MKVTIQFIQNGVLLVYNDSEDAVFVFEDGSGDPRTARSQAIVNAVWHAFSDWSQQKLSGGLILGFSECGRDEDH
tara:strand:+ start:1759 stop:1983 length:225 start_codon:yes stop_codon:yes gene_type:complete